MRTKLIRKSAIVVAVLCIAGAIGGTAALGSVTAINARTATGPLTGPDAAAGQLVVSAANPRYFTVGSGNAAGDRVVYLTGSHIWNNFHDGLGPRAECAETLEQNDFDA